MSQKNTENFSQNKVVGQQIFKEEQFPWYDSLWLSSFVNAKEFIRVNYPQKLSEFIEAFEILKTNPNFKVKEIQELFTEEQQAGIRNIILELNKNEIEKHELFTFGRTVIHDHVFLNNLQNSIIDKVSEIVGEPVEPCYNFLSLYNNLGVLSPHLDAPSAKWTVDYCIEQTSTWPIYISKVRPWPEEWRVEEDDDWVSVIKNDPENHFTSFELEAGKAIVFGGSSQWHYRERIEQNQKINFCHLVFFHFIPKGTSQLTQPGQWAKLFDIPELSDIIPDSV